MTAAFPYGNGPGSETWITSVDGVPLRVVHRAARSASESPRAVVLAHGFGGSADNPAVAGIAAGLAEHADVLSLDMRGHGRSGGLSTLGSEEILDVDAAVAHARSLGYERVITVGFSMGGSAVLRHAGLLGVRTSNPVDAVVAVSAPSRWFRTETPAMRRLHLMVGTPVGRLVARHVLGAQVDPAGWPLTPSPPEEVIGRIAPVPLLVVHGDADHYLGADNGPSLFEAAGEPRELWEWAGFGHAEAAMTPQRTAVLGGHLTELVSRKGMSG